MIHRITPPEAQALLEQGWRYLDVRTEQEFAQSHPAGALNIPFMHAGPSGLSPNPDFLKVAQAVLARDSKLVVGCLGGGRSIKAAQALEANGYAQLVDQRCGFGGTRTPQGTPEAGWAAQGLPVEAGAPKGRSYADLLAQASGAK